MRKKIQPAILFAIYGILILWAIAFKCNIDSFLRIELNQAKTLTERFLHDIIPFRKFVLDMAEGDWIELVAFILNFALLIPLGILLSFYMSPKRAVGTALACSFAVELYQLFSCMGGLDPTDVLINTLGAVTGVWLYRKIRPKMQDKTVEKILWSVSAVFAPLALYALVSTVLAFPRYIGYWTN